MNRNGFTLIEMIMSIFIVSVLFFIVGNFFGKTYSISKEESYKIMKKNIVSSANNYISECESKSIDCNMEWKNDEIEFSSSKLIEFGYFKSLNNPIDGSDLSSCLIIKAFRDNGSINIKLIDKCN